MGTEIIYPITIGLKWGLVVLLCAALTYALLFRFRNSSNIILMTLRVILGFIGILLGIPTLAYVGLGLGGLLLAIFDDAGPLSGRLVFVGELVAVGCLLFAAWRVFVRVGSHLERSLSPKADQSDLPRPLGTGLGSGPSIE